MPRGQFRQYVQSHWRALRGRRAADAGGHSLDQDRAPPGAPAGRGFGRRDRRRAGPHPRPMSARPSCAWPRSSCRSTRSSRLTTPSAPPTASIEQLQARRAIRRPRPAILAGRLVTGGRRPRLDLCPARSTPRSTPPSTSCRFARLPTRSAPRPGSTSSTSSTAASSPRREPDDVRLNLVQLTLALPVNASAEETSRATAEAQKAMAAVHQCNDLDAQARQLKGATSGRLDNVRVGDLARQSANVRRDPAPGGRRRGRPLPCRRGTSGRGALQQGRRQRPADARRDLPADPAYRSLKPPGAATCARCAASPPSRSRNHDRAAAARRDHGRAGWHRWRTQPQGVAGAQGRDAGRSACSTIRHGLPTLARRPRPQGRDQGDQRARGGSTLFSRRHCR